MAGYRVAGCGGSDFTGNKPRFKRKVSHILAPGDGQLPLLPSFKTGNTNVPPESLLTKILYLVHSWVALNFPVLLSSLPWWRFKLPKALPSLLLWIHGFIRQILNFVWGIILRSFTWGKRSCASLLERFHWQAFKAWPNHSPSITALASPCPGPRALRSATETAFPSPAGSQLPQSTCPCFSHFPKSLTIPCTLRANLLVFPAQWSIYSFCPFNKKHFLGTTYYLCDLFSVLGWRGKGQFFFIYI